MEHFIALFVMNCPGCYKMTTSMIFIRHLDRFLPNRQIFRPAHLPSRVSAAQRWRLGGVSIGLPADVQEVK